MTSLVASLPNVGFVIGTRTTRVDMLDGIS